MSDDFYAQDHQAWLDYLQPDGLVVSPAALVDAQALVDRNARPLQEAFLEHVAETAPNGDACLKDFLSLVINFLGWPEDCLVGAGGVAIPEELKAALSDGVLLEPTFALQDPQPRDPAKPWILLVKVLPDGTDLDARDVAVKNDWSASESQKFDRLLRESGVPIGLLVNGTHLRLLYAPKGENSGTLTFPVQAMTEVAGRIILSGFETLLGYPRLFALPEKDRLPALLARSRDYQSEVSTQLAQQVLDALYELLRGFQKADRDAKGELLRKVLAEKPDEVYGGLLTVLLRLVFLLFAEDRNLMPGSELYIRHYSIHGLFKRLRADQERYADTMQSRYGAWHQLLALFRTVYHGSKNHALTLPARSGHLFDPDRYPFLEGRPFKHSPVGEAPHPIPLIPDGTICAVLSKLLLLKGERLSYKRLDVEEIGSVYQTIMGFRLEIAPGPSIALMGKRKHKSEVPAPLVVNLAPLLASGKRKEWLKKEADYELPDRLAAEVEAATNLEGLLAALGPRIARNATPVLVSAGHMVLQPTDERRRSGSHYTPRKLTHPIVTKTLEPIFQRLGPNPTPAQILELKVCDPAMGSAAFLVETCRQLADKLVEAWRHHHQTPRLPPDEDEVLLARRTVAQHCLYGVDRNPMATDLAKLSLWLATLAKDHPFTFLDHALRTGDALVGLTQKQIESFTWEDPQGQQLLFAGDLRHRVKAALDARQALLALGDDSRTPALKREKLALAESQLEFVRFIGDAVLAAFFSSDKPKHREAKRQELAERLSAYVIQKDPASRPTEEVKALRAGVFGVTPFHWHIEYPEVFSRENPGFDAFVGNPPFAGRETLYSGSRLGFMDWVGCLHSGSHGNADLVAHFFRRAFSLIRNDGTLGFIATNTIGQGDTRSSGLTWICNNNGTIYSAVKRVKWPGQAAVVVSCVWITKGVAIQSI